MVLLNQFFQPWGRFDFATDLLEKVA
jgi:hypothetical protein